MKRILIFIITFLIFLGFAYFEPVFFGRHRQEESISLENMETNRQAYDSNNFATIGAAKYLGKPVVENKQLIKEASEYVEIKGKLEKVTFNQNSEYIRPFKLGMTLGELSQNILLRSNFEVHYNGATWNIELDEQAMNYYPLIQFANGTFAILYLARETGELTSITYVSRKSLLDDQLYMIFKE